MSVIHPPGRDARISKLFRGRARCDGENLGMDGKQACVMDYEKGKVGYDRN